MQGPGQGSRLLSQVLDVQQHGVLLRPQLVPDNKVRHQLGAESWKQSGETKRSVMVLSSEGFTESIDAMLC